MHIFDTFPFDAELDLLEHRLTENYDFVDAFVLVEAAETFSGVPKELTFARNRQRFAWADAKLRYVSLNALGTPQSTARERAAVQRDAVRLALRDAEPDDIVLLLDADEIPSHDVLRFLRAHGVDGPSRLLMTRHYEHVDALAPRSPCCPSHSVFFQAATPRLRPGEWNHLNGGWQSQSGVAIPFRALNGRNAFDLRFGEVDAPPLTDAGRHFSSVDPGARLEEKLGRVFHTEWGGERETRPAHLRRCRLHGVHHRGWWYAERPEGPLPDDLRRLADRLNDDAAAAPFPAWWRRRLVRTWAWLRLWRWLPEGTVKAIDRHFERLLPLAVVPLLAADLMRGFIAAIARAASAGRHSSSTTTNPRPDISCAKS